jgi:hypothetical protein
MKERPILFSAPMVRAILDGRKTQTRRVVKPQPTCGLTPCHWSPTGWGYTNPEGGCRCSRDKHGPRAPGAPGDRLWVRETFAAVYDCPDLPCECEEGAARHRRAIYAATEPDEIGDYACGFDCNHDEPGCARWTPSIHMPRWASRITLEVTGVRVERLQDISEEDAKAEGVERSNDERWPWRSYDKQTCVPFAKASTSFMSLWVSINGAGSWHADPWVWVVEFRRVEEQRLAAGGAR